MKARSYSTVYIVCGRGFRNAQLHRHAIGSGLTPPGTVDVELDPVDPQHTLQEFKQPSRSQPLSCACLELSALRLSKTRISNDQQCIS